MRKELPRSSPQADAIAGLLLKVVRGFVGGVRTIPIQAIDTIWEQVNNMDEAASNAAALRFQELQPYILVYLLAFDEELFAEEERGRLLELGMYLLESMYAFNADLPQVTDVELEAAQEANIQFLTTLEEGSPMDWEDAVQSLYREYNQVHLLGALLEALMSGYEEEPEMLPENVGMALTHLKTVIDCLDR